ncbi:hypothetical protein RHGRI_008322 [Rhododendron griersonianum]|uniref:CCR4-NOT transcription complex subunit 1 n=1 Tax=Rhododendron griersonianum TaxID=479676 RepID=A0AAV6KZY0_9ERIC|nr:hypothetical protein RHGRI_008322 [Rhododendron griersonianum]
MVLFSTLIAAQIRFLLQSLDKSNSDSVFRELCQFVDYGCEGSILLLQTCLDHSNFQEGDVHKMQLKSDLLAGIFRYLLQCPNFSSIFCEAMRNMVMSERFISDFCDALQLSLYEKVGVGLSLADSENVAVRTNGQNFCIGQIDQLLRSSAVLESAEQIQNVIMFLDHSEGLSKHVDSFMQMLYLMEPKERTPLILSPLLSHDTVEARDMDLFYGCRENEFDAILAEMASENSMSSIMSEMGYGCTVDASHCNEVLSLFLPLTEATLSRILGTIARTHTGLVVNQNYCSTFYTSIGGSATYDLSCLSSWNIDVLVDSIKQLAPDTNWIHVMENLDHEGFYLPSGQSFSLLMSIYHRASQVPFPLHALYRSVWKNVEGQLSFLRYAVSAPPEVFTFAHSSRKLACANALSDKVVPQGLTNHAWISLDLLEVLCHLAERGHAKSVRQILDSPLKQCPELLLLGIAQINTPYNLLQYEVFSDVFPIIVAYTTGSSIVRQLWQSNPKLVLQGFLDIMRTDQGNMVKVLDICQELKILSSILEQVPIYFSIRLAVVATRKKCINFVRWLDDNIRTHKDVFVEECLEFLKEMLFTPEALSEDSFQHSCGLANLNLNISSTILKALDTNAVHITSEKLSEELKRFCKASTDVGLRLQNVRNSDSTPPDECSDDIEAEANTYFRELFSGQMTSDAMVEMLARFRKSSERREQLIFERVIQKLFEECCLFPRYPERQLNTTAVLVGSLIKHRLGTDLTLGLAIRTVLDALRNPPDRKIFAFGTLALEQFLDRLVEIPQLCHHILQISHLRGTRPKLVAYIERTLAQKSSCHLESNGSSASAALCGGSTTATVKTMEKENNVSTAVTSPAFVHSSKTITSTSTLRQNSHTMGFGSALNIETLVAAAERRDTSMEYPASSTQDKILFMINNMSSSNIEAKAKEFSELLSEQHYHWFAQYMVMKRASIEPNFHDLYMKFLDKVNSKTLNQEITKAAYENCKVLLRSELIKSSSEERSLLKNLGSWLGKFTIGRNQALRARDIDPKSLIIEAYEKGLMIAVIPFTSKILEPCQNSLAYRPPNPWTMAILGLLAEIYVLPNLKMNLKFDIEVLFKNLGVDMKVVKPTSLLKDRARESQGNPDFSMKDMGASQPQLITETNTGIVSTFNAVDLQPDIISSTQPGAHLNLLSQDEKMATLSLSDWLASGQGLPQVPPSQSQYSVGQLSSPIHDIGSHIIFNQKLSALGLQYFERSVPLAIKRAIEEVMDHVVQHNVTIATQTTKELVLKDYAMESDETPIYNAAHSMVASLAGSLTRVTCKDALRVSILNHLRNSLQASNISSELQEQAVAIILNDNLDLCCAVIQHATTDNALKTVDNEISQQLSLRRKHRDYAGQSYYNASLYTQGPMSVIPEVLRPRPGHLSHSQQRVYEEFVRFPWQNLSGQNSIAVPAAVPVSSADSFGAGVSRTYVLSAGMLSLGLSSSEMGNLGSGSVAQPADRISEEVDPSSARLLSGSSTRNVATNGTIQSHVEVSNAALNSSPATVLEPRVLETSNAMKKLGRTLPPFLATSTVERMAGGISESLLTTGDALEKYQIVAQKLETLVNEDSVETEIQGVIAQVPEIILRCISRDEAALAVAQKVFKSLFENASNSSHVKAHIKILAAIRDVCKLVVKELTSWVIYSDEKRKFKTAITVGLIREDLLNLSEYNMHIAKLIDAGRNKTATEFAISLLQILLVEDSRGVVSELPNLVDVLSKLATKAGSPESLQLLVKIASNPAANAAALDGFSVGNDDKANECIEKKGSDNAILTMEELINADPGKMDLSAFNDQVSGLFAEWYRISESRGPNDAACSRFLSQLQQNGYLDGDDMSDRFFHHLMQLSVTHCLSTEGISSSSRSSSFHLHQTSQDVSFLAVDMYAKLVVLVLKFCVAGQGPNKLLLWPKILSVAVRVLHRDAEENRVSFNPRPYFRLFISWILDLLAPDSILQGSNLQVLIAFANAFHVLQPLKVPAFSFAWLELVSHRSFMPKLLTVNPLKGWPLFQHLLVDLLKFMEPHLRKAKMGKAIHYLYKGTLRVLVLLLHDFPEFLCDYHLSFCGVIPSSCIQMRNIILSAFPHNMKVPDPFTPNLKIDLLPEIKKPPRSSLEVAALTAKQMKSDIDEYLKTRHQGSFLSELMQRLLLTPNEAAQAGTRYNVPLMNSLVLYTGMKVMLSVCLVFCTQVLYWGSPSFLPSQLVFYAELYIQQLTKYPSGAWLRNFLSVLLEFEDRFTVQTLLSCTQRVVCLLCLVMSSLPQQNRSLSLKGPHYYKFLQSVQLVQANTPSPLAQQTDTDLREYLRGPAFEIFQIREYMRGPAFEIFQMLIAELDYEGRYLFLNSIANQLQYPNNLTHFFYMVLLNLFAEANQEIIQEQITRVLLERFIANRPHPWGLLVTFMELIKNPKYNFWSSSFIRCAPEIENLVRSVSRSCGGPEPVDESTESGGIPYNNVH